MNGFNSNVLTLRGGSEAKISVLFALVSKIKPNAFSYRLLGYLRGKGGFKGHGNVGTLNEMMQKKFLNLVKWLKIDSQVKKSADWNPKPNFKG